MVSEDRLKRARTALDELESGEMSVEPNGGGTFDVKGYEVKLDEVSCTCKDHEYNERFCKHYVAAQLQAMWGNIAFDGSIGENPDPPKPDVLQPRFDNIPDYLRERDQWVCWKQKLHENKDGSKRWTKVPVDVSGGFASSTDAETWCSFSEAVGHYNANDDVVGVGFVVGDETDDVVGVDIDDCRDPDGGIHTDEVLDIIDRVDTYGEVSPSGTGIRLFVRGDPAVEECEADLPGEAHIERYYTGRYLTVTGHQLVGLPDEVTADEATLNEVDRRMAED